MYRQKRRHLDFVFDSKDVEEIWLWQCAFADKHKVALEGVEEVEESSTLWKNFAIEKTT